VLSDPDKTAARAYGVLGPTGYASRWTFFIGPDGRVAGIDRQVDFASHGPAIVARLKALGVSEV
jgi:peroxiredoxin Q/BCP